MVLKNYLSNNTLAMTKNILKEINPMKLSKLFYGITVLLASTAFFLSISSVMQHPLIGDDRHFLWDLSDHGSFFVFIAHYYNNWGGNIFHTIIWSGFSYSPMALYLYKLTLVPMFVAMAALAYYLATNTLPDIRKRALGDFIIFITILWLAIPEIGQTIAWATGSVYLYMTLCALIYLSLINNGRQKILLGKDLNYGLVSGIFIFIFSFFLGTSSIQIFSSISFIILYWFWMLRKQSLLKRVPFIFYVSLAGFLLGFLVLIIAPGNYERLATYEAPDFISRLLKYFMYLAGAYFSGGSGNLGASLILGSLIIMLLGSFKTVNLIKQDSIVWFGASLSSLAPMIIAVDFTSSRTTFMATVFLLIGIKSLVKKEHETSASYILISYVPILCCLLVIVDSFVGWASNRSLAGEVENRMQIIELSIQANEQEIIVPYFTTIPSRQTFMLKPNHDQEYLDIMAKHFEVTSIRHDNSEGAPKPNTLHPLKALRESL